MRKVVIAANSLKKIFFWEMGNMTKITKTKEEECNQTKTKGKQNDS